MRIPHEYAAVSQGLGPGMAVGRAGRVLSLATRSAALPNDGILCSGALARMGSGLARQGSVGTSIEAAATVPEGVSEG